MTSYTKNNLYLVSQGIGGKRKVWIYTDTAAVTTIAESAGYWTDADDLGLDTGDLVLVFASGGGVDARVHATTAKTVQDTGATQGTPGTMTVIADTS